MVTRAAKDLLRNTIRTVDHHNRLLEEQEMWRQWELEQGLTMMVSDDCLRMRQAKGKAVSSREELERIKKRQKIEKYRRQCDNTRDCKRKHNYWMKKLMEVEEQDPERWGHGGYKTLYPDEFEKSLSKKRKSSRHRRSERKKKRRKRSRSQERKPSKSKRSPLVRSQLSSSSSNASTSSCCVCDLHKSKAENISDGDSDNGCEAELNSYEEHASHSSENSKRHHRHHRYHQRHHGRHQHSKDRKDGLKQSGKNHRVELNYQAASTSDSSDNSISIVYESCSKSGRESRD